MAWWNEGNQNPWKYQRRLAQDRITSAEARGSVRRPSPWSSGMGMQNQFMGASELNQLQGDFNRMRNVPRTKSRYEMMFKERIFEDKFKASIEAARGNGGETVLDQQMKRSRSSAPPSTRHPAIRTWNAWAGSTVHRGGVDWVKMELGVGKHRHTKGALQTGGKWLGRGFVGLSAYMGYQEGGVGGAIAETGKHLATTYIMGAAMTALGGAGTVALGAGALGVGAAAAYVAGGGNLLDVARPWMRDHARRSAALEMGTPLVDNFGTAATMRQRSVSAIQNSKLNGRTALGNEAALSYTPY
jgi:hypothetical protein